MLPSHRVSRQRTLVSLVGFAAVCINALGLSHSPAHWVWKQSLSRSIYAVPPTRFLVTTNTELPFTPDAIVRCTT